MLLPLLANLDYAGGGLAVSTNGHGGAKRNKKRRLEDPWFPGNQDDWTHKTTAEVMNVEVEELAPVSGDVLTVEDEQEIERLIQSAETSAADLSQLLTKATMAIQAAKRRRREEEEELILMAILRRN